MAKMGENEGLPTRLSPEEEMEFPNLIPGKYSVKSKKCKAYNCIAFAAGDTTKKWDPTGMPLPGYYWPEDVDRGDGPDSLRALFESLGYELCNNCDSEDGFEKVAIYIDNDGEWTHAARLEDTGEWCSKLGLEEDIQHDSPHCFSGSIYGNVCYWMKRKLDTSNEQEEAGEDCE